jgi:hypothetical protein
VAQRQQVIPSLLEPIEDANETRRSGVSDDEHTRFVYSLVGRCADVLSSTEEYLRRKQLEIDREDWGLRSGTRIP